MVFSEAELLKSVQHKNIVKLLNCFALKSKEVVFIMEYLEGGELGKYLKSKGKFTESEALGFFTQLVDAISFCHGEKLIHRDLKLENILLASSNSNLIKVVDFGIAGVYSNVSIDVSEAGSIRYMAPEVITGKNRAANPAIDIWSMGCILYAMVHGVVPFDGNRKEIIDKIKRGNYELSKTISRECSDLINKMLTVDYKERITLIEIKNHPWMTGGTLPQPE
jgi:serine/threonine protein kinase